MKKLVTLFLTAVILFSAIPVFAATNISIDSVEFEEYTAHLDDGGHRMVIVNIKYTVPSKNDSVSLVLLGKNTTDLTDFAEKTIYIDQIDDPTGEYSFVIEKSRISSALGTNDIEGKTLYFKLGSTSSTKAALKEITYETPNYFTFDGASVRTDGEQGLRFTFSMPLSVYDQIAKPAESSATGLGFGSVVMPADYLGDEVLVKDLVTTTNGVQHVAITVPAVKIFGQDENCIYFTVCLTNIPESKYNYEYVAVPYVTFTDNEQEITLYGTETENVTVFNIAKKWYENTDSETEKEFAYNNILSVVDPVTYPAK